MNSVMVMELAAPFRDDAARHFSPPEGARGCGTDCPPHRGNETRPCRLAPDGIAAIDQWPEVLRDALSKNDDRLDEVLATMKPAERKDMR
jgi:hypothetical protein